MEIEATLSQSLSDAVFRCITRRPSWPESSDIPFLVYTEVYLKCNLTVPSVDMMAVRLSVV